MRTREGRVSSVLGLANVRANTDVRTAIRHVRRRWSASDLHYLHTWVGTRPLRMLCRHLQRTERALRCKLHKLGLSAKVCEGWDIAQIRRVFHMGKRTLLRHVVTGKLRLQCAQVHIRCSRATRFDKSMLFAADGRWREGILPAMALPIGEVAARQHRTIARLCAAALAGQCRLIHLRITEATAIRFYAERAH